MTDRIDELVEAAREGIYGDDRTPAWQTDGALNALDRLATIARESEKCDDCKVFDAGWCVVDEAGGPCRCMEDGDFACIEKRHLTALEAALGAKKVGGEYIDVRVKEAQAEADKWRKVAEWLANEAACYGISCFHNHPDDHEQTGSCEEAGDRESCAAYRLAAALAALEGEDE